jgi:hypothetical protein
MNRPSLSRLPVDGLAPLGTSTFGVLDLSRTTADHYYLIILGLRIARNDQIAQFEGLFAQAVTGAIQYGL